MVEQAHCVSICAVEISIGGCGQRLCNAVLEAQNWQWLAKRSSAGYKAELMPVSCFAYNCTNCFVKGKGTKFYRFPRDLEC